MFVGLTIGWYVFGKNSDLLPSPFIFEESVKQYPYKNYTFSALRNYPYKPSVIVLEREIKKEEKFSSYIFSYSPLGKKMTGQINIPTEVTPDTPVIVMIRGFVPLEIFTSGTGTRNGAAAYANAGFITLAPDFFGYGESDPEPDDSWQARFEKPIIVIELLKSIKQYGLPIPSQPTFTTNNIGLWGHSNGGHIALSVLEITKEPYPTALWAPVTAPFPYSVLFFSDEDEDEGKGMRLWVNQLEKDYDLQEFSITHYLDGLLGPIQLHHGTADEAALKVWSDEFIQKIEKENDRRAALKEIYKESASESAKAADPFLQPVDITYFQYPGADHNMQPGWDTVVERDIEFYSEKLKK
jgi:dienelactone hydrolase